MGSRVIQEHHVIYGHPDHKTQNDVTVKLYKGEHKVISNLSWYTRKTLSAGLIKTLKVFVALNEDRAVEL